MMAKSKTKPKAKNKLVLEYEHCSQEAVSVHDCPAVFTIEWLTIVKNSYVCFTCGSEIVCLFVLTFKPGVDAQLD